MIEDDKGHDYKVQNLESEGEQRITFIKRSSGMVKHDTEHPGTNTQEVIRVLIARSKYLDSIGPCDESKDAIWHLRQALYCYEARAWQRKQEKVNGKASDHNHAHTPNIYRDGYDGVPFGWENIEDRPVGPDGHIIIETHPCDKQCQYAIDIGMAPYHSCSGECMYDCKKAMEEHEQVLHERSR